MDGKVALVTGATNGIGKVTALELAKLGATVVLSGRSGDRAQATVAEIQQRSGNPNVAALVADLSVMSEVRRLADEFKAKHDRLHVLVNNAGGVFPQRRETDDGYEMTFALNHLSYFLLTNLLLDVLTASAPARIVNVSSDAHRGGRMQFDDLNFKQTPYGIGGWKAYSQSKLANVLFTYELARRLAGSGVTANVLHPGFVATGFGRTGPGLMSRVMGLLHRFALTPEEGARTTVYLASSAEVEGVTGQYFDKSKAVPSSKTSYDEEAQRRLWAISEQMTGLAQSTTATAA
ncbi:MAG: SDR family oxidoreductase [Chloroflexi bacterium]|nr:SDR family oxidoreductase [Chloroflexota bacterium]